MDHLPDPRWQDALAHSRFLANLLHARPALVAELADSWTQPLAPEILEAAMAPPAGDDETLKTQLAACASAPWRTSRCATWAAWRRSPKSSKA
jgi:hypothetical protein